MTTRYLVVGAGGLLGVEMVVALDGRDMVGLDRKALDVTDPQAVTIAVRGFDVVINCAAYTQVDAAETDEYNAHRVNTVAAETLASAVSATGGIFVQISTDYVFAGDEADGYVEETERSPLSVYGRTKAEGERLAVEANARTIIVRTAWLYGAGGDNFAAKMLALAETRGRVDVVNDQMGQPTWSRDVAERIVAILDSGATKGIFHATNSGRVTWFGFAQRIYANAGLSANRVRPTSSAAFPSAARRPSFSVLSSVAAEQLGIRPMRSWTSALAEAMKTGALGRAPLHPTVLVDATAIPQDRSGVGRYVDELLRSLDQQVVIACQAIDEEHYRTLAPSAIVLPQRGIRGVAKRLLWEQLVLPRVARRAKVRLIHSPHYTLPLLSRLIRVVTFHDATFFSEPVVHTRFKRVFFRAWIRMSNRLADAIIVPSAATAREIGFYVHPRQEYSVVHHGVDQSIFHPATPDEVSSAAVALGLDRAPWIAFLGTIEPRKNLPELVRAYSRLADTWTDDDGSIPSLALAGGAGWGDPIEPEIENVSPRGQVVMLGYVDLAVIPAFLGGALLVIYPSLGEGFGLPVLEAMSCGAPVLTTRRLALPEVGGDAVAYSGTDSESLYLAMRQLIAEPATRSELSRLGRERAAQFTWKACADKHVTVFELAMTRDRAARA